MRGLQFRLHLTHLRWKIHRQNARRFQSSSTSKSQRNVEDKPKDADSDEGAMVRRLSQMTETALETGGKSARQAVNEAQFDEQLRRRLQDRIASANIRSEHPSAYAKVEAPTSAGPGAQEIAGSRAWSGTETVDDTARRMLEDSHKQVPSIRVRNPPTRAQISKASIGSRIESAIDQSTTYTALKESGMTPEEKEQFLKEQRARFQPGARDIPATLSGLASLANERIEYAIARGQFKNLPRGKPLENDHNASSPFIDTTEYLMNKMIKKQDIVPPWIEKQKEVTTAVGRFRARLRSDWKRHAARVIASYGGSLSQQIRRAEEFAAAELSQMSKSQMSEEHCLDKMSQISPSGQLKSSGNKNFNPRLLEEENTVKNPNSASGIPFRDVTWEATESAFHQLSIKSLNSLTRSYNLMAPRTAQRPYYNLERELKACYVDVAPLIAEEIRQRAFAPKRTSLLESISSSHYGKPGISSTSLPASGVSGFRWRDLWRDIWATKSS
jgi:hypothetical protein